jgi:L-histidine Nalpha-methyltransferase
MASVVVEPVVEVRGGGGGPDAARRELVAALHERPRRIPSKHFYDEVGSRLFEEICTLPEYYPTRTERAILEAEAGEIARLTRATQLVELGSGAAEKTRLLLEALRPPGGPLECYVPFDVSEEVLRRSAEELAAAYPGLRIHAIAGDFNAGIGPLPAAAGPRLVAFLGGTIGNLDPESEAPAFLQRVVQALAPGDAFLLGVDLVKDPALLEAAYDDSRGVTAEFNRNILRVVNGLLDSDFAPERFAHRALWNRERGWIEMRLVAQGRQVVRLGAVGETLALDDGEEILTEISAKYRPEAVERCLTAAGLEPVRRFTDPDEAFSLFLARLVPAAGAP